jgi:hypothetical protein
VAVSSIWTVQKVAWACEHVEDVCGGFVTHTGASYLATPPARMLLAGATAWLSALGRPQADFPLFSWCLL